MSEGKNSFPLEIVDVEPKLAGDLMKLFTGEHTGFVQVGPKKYLYPHKYRQEASKFYNMPLRSDDIFVTSYPRSGTTWTQELVWMVANDLDYEKAAAIPITTRYPFLEYSIHVHPKMYERFRSENSDSVKKLELLELVTQNAQSGTEKVAAMPSPRFVKTHLPLSLLPPTLLDTAKVVYVARDPRDVAVSFYHMKRLLRVHGYIGDFETFWNYFRRDLISYSPFFDHLKEAWEKRNHPNLLFLFYEELLKDLPSVVRKVASFFNKQYSEEQVMKLCDHLSIDNFKKNKSVNYDFVRELGMSVSGEQGFVRKGKSGGWRDYFDEHMTQEADSWMADCLKDTDLRFPHLHHLTE